MQLSELLARHAQFDAAKRVGLDQVHEFPADRTRRELFFEAADGHGRDEPLEEAANCAFHSHIHLGDAHFDVSISALLGKVNVVDADDLSAIGVDNLLVEKILAYGQPSFIGVKELESGLVGAETHAAGDNRRDLVVTSDNRAVLATAQQQARDAVGLVGRLNEHLFYAADEVPGRIVGFGAQNLSGMKHVDSLRVAIASESGDRQPAQSSGKKKARTGIVSGHGQMPPPSV